MIEVSLDTPIFSLVETVKVGEPMRCISGDLDESYLVGADEARTTWRTNLEGH